MKTLSWMRGVVVAGSLLLCSGGAQALLVDRGGGMLYDDVLNVTWLQDANYARTSGYCNTAGNCFATDGQMTWTQATTWANNLVYGGYSDWRLASNSPVNGTGSGWNYSYSNSGTTDVGYNITATFSELSYMYYVNLGLKGYYSPAGVFQSDWGIHRNGMSGGEADVGLVKNLQSDVYWSGTAYAAAPADRAWRFYAYRGNQGYGYQSFPFFAWAVRPGDVSVAVVPVPASLGLLLCGTVLLGALTRRRGRLGASGA
jgi:hypothetical protein